MAVCRRPSARWPGRMECDDMPICALLHGGSTVIRCERSGVRHHVDAPVARRPCIDACGGGRCRCRIGSRPPRRRGANCRRRPSVLRRPRGESDRVRTAPGFISSGAGAIQTAAQRQPPAGFPLRSTYRSSSGVSTVRDVAQRSRAGTRPHLVLATQAEYSVLTCSLRCGRVGVVGACLDVHGH